MNRLFLPCGKETIVLEIHRSDRRTMGLEVKRDASVHVRVPRGLPDYEIKQFVDKHSAWIIEKYKKQKAAVAEAPAKAGEEDGRLSPLQRRKAELIILPRVKYYAKLMGLNYQKVTIRNQKTRWGSCSARGNLNFNYRLAAMPQELLDYVVIHELAHLRHMNHSADFWREVATYCPDYRDRRTQLKSVVFCGFMTGNT